MPTWKGLGFPIPNPLAEREVIDVPMHERVQTSDLAPAAINLFSLAFCLAGMSALMSSWDKYRWRTIGIVFGNRVDHCF